MDATLPMVFFEEWTPERLTALRVRARLRGDERAFIDFHHPPSAKMKAYMGRGTEFGIPENNHDFTYWVNVTEAEFLAFLNLHQLIVLEP